MNYRLCTADSIILQQEDFTHCFSPYLEALSPTALTPNPNAPRVINEGAPKSDYLFLMKFYHFVQHGATHK
ncbi:hypothetical protein F7725_007727 [Dissostichus mawsoni]|uniref:Uncharacterized protein n=1 Tax=Dissostichus mawsoni TaxID=36200 RepID=A0A7J5Y564_DISMA|nr:hypothetical protein F7725_007727 [Dissostichus mawsoni]